MDGFRRFDSKGAYPTVYQFHPEGRGRSAAVKVATPGFRAFRPQLHREGNDIARMLVDGGTHPHGYFSNFEYRFSEDWISVRWKPGGRIAFDWTDLQSRRGFHGESDPDHPSLIFLIDGDGTRLTNMDVRQYKGPVQAWFDRPNGRRHGAAMFYPDGAIFEEWLPWHEGRQPMGFTFCTEQEFPELLRKWRAQLPPAPIPAWSQGESRK